MGMSSSQPQPVTQGTMGSPRGTGGGMPMADPSSTASFGQMGVPTKNYGPVGGMVNSAQNQVNPQSSPASAMNNLMGSLPGQNTAPQQPQIQTQTVPPGNSHLPRNLDFSSSIPLMPTGQGMGSQMNSMGNHNFMPMGNAGFMPMGNAGFMPMGNHNFMPMGFGQMPTFGGPRGGKAPQGGGNPQPQVAQTNPSQAMGGDPYAMGANPNTGRQVRAGYQGGPQTVAYQKQATDNYDGFYSVPYAYDPSIAKSDYGKIGAGNLGASAGFL